MARRTVWDTLRRWFRPPRRLKVTRLGRTYLVITFGIGLGALNTGNNLLYLVLGFLLSIIVMSGVLSENAIWDIEVRRVLPDGAFAQEPFALRYAVTRRRGQAFALRLTERGGLVESEAWVPLVRAAEPVTVRADATAKRRGPARLTAIELSTTFPLGIFEKSRTIELEDLLVVYPRRGFACEPLHTDHGQEVGDSGSPRLRDGTGDILGLRELAPREDARRVHWKKSAAVGRLLKVEREREDRRQYTLKVDAAQPLECLDRACEETAAVAHLLFAQGHEVGLVAGKRRLRPSTGAGHERRVLAALAWLGFDQDLLP